MIWIIIFIVAVLLFGKQLHGLQIKAKKALKEWLK